MKTEYICGGVGAACGAVGTALQLNDVLQTISLILTILGAIVSFVIVPLLSWYKSAKKDGKIDANELKEAAEIIKEGAEKTKGGIKGSQTEYEDKRKEIEKDSGKGI